MKRYAIFVLESDKLLTTCLPDLALVYCDQTMQAHTAHADIDAFLAETQERVLCAG